MSKAREVPLDGGSRDAVDKLEQYEAMAQVSQDTLSAYGFEDEDLRAREANAIARRLDADAQERETMANQAEDDRNLRKKVCKWAIKAVSRQLVVCNVGIVAYGAAVILRGGELPAEVILGWVAACLVEVIGILVVIVKSLFPKKGDDREEKAGVFARLLSRGTPE